MGEYETDILAWSEHQGALLRRRAAGELVNDAAFDWPGIAEEIESLGRSERSALASHIRTIIEHLAKLTASPAGDPRAGWEDTVLRARIDVEELLAASPSLRYRLDDVVAQEHGRALRLAESGLRLHGEAPQVPLDTIRFTTGQVLGPWLPT
jgi:Domain of unknown function DUF29